MTLSNYSDNSLLSGESPVLYDESKPLTKVEKFNDYLFDLQGFFKIENAVEPRLVGELTEALLSMREVEPDGWIGNVWRLPSSQPDVDVELQNIVEGGVPFEELIDHPSWINYMRRYCAEASSPWEGLFIDECFGKIRGLGDYHRFHSGGYRSGIRTQYRYEHGVFRCGQINLLVALTDIGPGDGGTLLIPGSHKSNFPHPQRDELNNQGGRMDEMVGVVNPTLRRGDALLFVDSITHGTATRTNPVGERLTVLYRYGPGWAVGRRGYRYSEELLARLTPQRRRILEPIPPRVPAASTA
jgi:hypothetical protein